MQDIENIIKELKTGKAFEFSYESYAAESRFNIRIEYLSDKNTFKVQTTEKPAYYEEENRNEEKIEATLRDFLVGHADYIKSTKHK